MINIKFKKVILHNFLCFDHSEVYLDNLGYTIVSGKNNRTIDNATSNGSGKSSIFNAISYALTGETIQGLSKNIENIYADPNDCWVELDFDVNNDNFRIKRIKTPKQDLKIYINGQNKSGKGIKESGQVLSKYLPDLTSMLLGSVIILGQGLPCKFTEGHPGARKEKLEKLTKSDYMIQSVRTKLDNRKLELSTQLRSHEDSKIKAETQIKIFEQQLAATKKDIEDYSEYLVDGSIKNAVENVNKQINESLGLLGNLGVNKTKLENKIEEAKNNYSELELKYSKELDEVTNPLLEQKEISNASVLSLESEINVESKRLKALDKVTDVCPTCGQKLLNVTKIDTSADWKLVEESKANLKELKSAYKKITTELEKTKNNILKNKDEALQEINITIKDDQKQLKKIESEINNVKIRYQTLLQEESKLSAFENNFSKLSKTKQDLEEKLTTLKEQLTQLSSAITNDNEHLQVITNLISLTKREFRGILLENVINYINSRVKFYSMEVFNSDLLSFSLNENYIDIMYDNKYYEALSGGEKQKVDIIIQLALRDLLSSQLGINSNILVIDEIFDFLDTKGCAKILNLITNLHNIDSIFIISHHIDELAISYDNEIVVEKGENGISHISSH